MRGAVVGTGLMKISVYITSYNQKGYLREAIESVLAQTLKPFEVLVADDGSTDGSPEMIRAYEGRYGGLVRGIFHDRNMGVARTRVDALAAVRGEAVSYVDGDDRWLPEKLEREAAALAAHPEAAIAFSNHYYVTAAGERTGRWVEAGHRPPEGEVFCETFGRWYPRRDIFRMELIRMDAFRRVGFHDVAFETFEDYDLRIRLTKALRTVYVDEPLAEVRRHGGGLSSAAAERQVETLMRVYRKNRGLLADVPPEARRLAVRGFRRWVGPFAREAAVRVVNDASRGFWARRVKAAGFLWRAIRYAPDSVRWGDLYRVFLPARTAERLND